MGFAGCAGVEPLAGLFPQQVIPHFAFRQLLPSLRHHARLSPSILRDFLSFTLFGLPGQREQMIERQGLLSNTHREVSREKLAVAQAALRSLFLKPPRELRSQVCAFIAGDLAYYLAHNEPCEHAATGEMLKGSDIDIVIFLQDSVPEEVKSQIDAEMTSLKFYYMRHPDHRHEIDFICKRQSVMQRQFGYADIHDKIASKIAWESMFLAGSLTLYMDIREAMTRTGVDKLIEEDFDHALRDRKNAMRTLLSFEGDILDGETRSLFYFSQERVEFS